jgi:RimJ/RimL family protein N-acetyltransferase
MTTLLIPALRLIPTRSTASATRIVLRTTRPDDTPALQDFVRALSPTSRRLRFHSALRELSEATLRALTHVDQRAHVAFVLTSNERGQEQIVGEARYVVTDDGATAEFGIAVADAYRGRGLAERLLAALVDAARAAGLRWLVGDVLADNARMLAFVRRCGFAESTRGAEPGLVRVERCVDRPLAAAHGAGWWMQAAGRLVRQLLASSRRRSPQAALYCQPF